LNRKLKPWCYRVRRVGEHFELFLKDDSTFSADQTIIEQFLKNISFRSGTHQKKSD
jgi:hypothetical protein